MSTTLYIKHILNTLPITNNPLHFSFMNCYIDRTTDLKNINSKKVHELKKIIKTIDIRYLSKHPIFKGYYKRRKNELVQIIEIYYDTLFNYLSIPTKIGLIVNLNNMKNTNIEYKIDNIIPSLVKRTIHKKSSIVIDTTILQLNSDFYIRNMETNLVDTRMSNITNVDISGILISMIDY